jgi:hypothetical protein
MSVFRSKAPISTLEYQQALVAGAVVSTGGGPLSVVALRLSTATPFNPAPGSTIGDLAVHEATFSGYEITYQPGSDLGQVTLSQFTAGALARKLFVAEEASPFVANNLTGYWIDNGGIPTQWEAFPPPGIPISGPGDFLDLLVGIPFNPAPSPL